MKTFLSISLLGLGCAFVPACGDDSTDDDLTAQGGSLRGGRDDDAGAGDAGGAGRACTTVAQCAAGEECDDGACKAHGGNGGKSKLLSNVACSADSECGSGECDDGLCKAHGGDDDGSHDGGSDDAEDDAHDDQPCTDGGTDDRGHDGADDADAGPAGSDAGVLGGQRACSTDSDCTGGFECDDGLCKAHGGGAEDTRGHG
jgi:hypothetical protein